ncbi:unnamed protein product [Sordaria macrospora k-hell]|uniref:WGS project CABT00000000 data, contig 2.92 n=2 Tax=Sordaria macrospora TaxID=5147 RepID=F7WC12_SORMK|nr:uncharacterized protein SMAC_09444 [Sordaria macrospora k-hell]CCC05515.1 unnamed protein product [Sordaria macrospora k-hell]
MSTPDASPPTGTGLEVDKDWDDSPYVMARIAITKPSAEQNPDAFALLKRLHNQMFGFNDTWPDAIKMLYEKPSLASMVREWPAFLVFPCLRGPSGEKFNIDLARRILRDDQMRFRLGYAVSVLGKIFEGRGNKESKERFSERLCNNILWKIWKRREPEVRMFWRKLEEEGKIPEEEEAGVGKAREEQPEEGSPNSGKKWRVSGTPFDRGVSRANSDLHALGNKPELEFDADAWQDPEPESPSADTPMSDEEMDRNLTTVGHGWDGERIFYRRGTDGQCDHCQGSLPHGPGREELV